MNAFDRLMALGVARTRAVINQQVSIGAVSDVAASVSPIRRESRLDPQGTPFWINLGDLTIGMDVWPANTATPQTGQPVILADGSKYRVGPVTTTPALIALQFTSLD